MSALQTQCPSCHSYKVIDQRNCCFLGGTLLTIFSLPWVFLIFPILFVFAGLSVAIGGCFVSITKRLRCRACGFQFPKVVAA